MNLDDFRKLSPEQAMQAAAQDLSLPDSFFDRQWAQESSRGQNMRSPAGAQGHFGIMPATQRAWEQRDGASYNPDDFYDGLYMAYRTMGENLARFKDPVDATRAYNSGWDPSKWNNPETVGYVNALWGGQQAPNDGRPMLPSLKASRPPKPQGTTADALAMDAINGLPFADESGIQAGREQAAADARAAEQAQARRDATHFSDALSESLRDPRVMPTWALLQHFGDYKAPDPNYDYMARRGKIEAGLDEEERQYLRENAVSDASEQRALGELAYRRSLNQTYADAGGFATFAGQMVAGMADPAALMTGVAVGKMFQLGRIGATAGAAGRVGALVAEGAAANMAIEGLADAAGEVKTSSDYAMAGLTGAAMVLPFARGVYRQAANAEVERLARGLQEKAADEQVAKVSDVMREEPNLTPEQTARRVEDRETEQIQQAVQDGLAPQRMDPVVPHDVQQEMVREFSGDVPDDAGTAPVTKREPPLEPPATEEQPSVATQLADKREAVREFSDGETAVRLSFNAVGNKQKSHGTVGAVLDLLHANPVATPLERRFMTYLKNVLNDDALDVSVRFSERPGPSLYDPNGPQIRMNDKKNTGATAQLATLEEQVANLTHFGVATMLHEITHVATVHRIFAWQENPTKLRPDQQKVMKQLEDLFGRFQYEVQQHPVGNPRHGPAYSASRLEEFVAQFFTDADTRYVLAQMPGKPVAGRVTSALRELMGIVRRVLGTKGDSAFDEGARLIDQLIAMPVDNIRYHNGAPLLFAPDANGVNPRAARRSRDSWAERMTQYAQRYVERNPIDTARLKTMTAKIGGASDGLVLAASKNPIMQLVASLVTETTTGAAGRKANVAIRSRMLTHKFVGNTLMDYDAAYSVWRNRNGGTMMEDLFKGDKRRQFDQAVYEEVLRRRSADYVPNRDKTIVEAADSLEGLFDRSRVAQIEAGVLGHGNLPTSSRGYIPQALDGIKLQAATVKDIALLHEGLAKQFEERLGWDRQFTRDFAPFYTERARRRAMGDKSLEALGAGGEGLQLVRDTLEEMQADPSMVDRARAAASALGQSHTKKRIDLDLLQELRPGLRMLDFYSTNPMLLARSYAKRTAGTVALTEAGIHGIRGVRELEQAALWKGLPTEQQPTASELEAYRRVMAEVLGTPVATAVVSNGATNMGLLVGLQRLGGLAFTQAAETFNIIHHLGLRSLLAGVADLPKMMGEVGRLKRGAPSGNHILTSIEQYGGEIGMEGYKMVAPLDAPEGRLAEYVDQPGVITRLLRAGGHLQAKIGGFRGLLAAQHRMVAEQIVMRAARFIRDGGESVALRDMGFTPEVVDAMRRDLKNVAKWDANDHMLEFDLTKVSDARIAEAFVQAVHRGTSQIIQGTFIGERSKWMHNDYLRLLLQLRSFGITSMEKQWGRTRMNYGYAYAAGIMLGQMALVLPIHLARVQLASIGRQDRDKFIKDNLNPAALARATMNYASISGSTGDVLDILTGLAGGWTDQQNRELIGAKQNQATSIAKVIPAAGSIDTALRVASKRTDLYTALKQLPFSNLWYLLPAVNLTKH